MITEQTREEKQKVSESDHVSPTRLREETTALSRAVAALTVHHPGTPTPGTPTPGSLTPGSLTLGTLTLPTLTFGPHNWHSHW